MKDPTKDPHAIAAKFFSVKRMGDAPKPGGMPPQVPVGVPNNPINWKSHLQPQVEPQPPGKGPGRAAKNPYEDEEVWVGRTEPSLVSPSYPGVREAMLRTNEDMLFPNGQLPLMEPASPLQNQPPMPAAPPIGMLHPGTGKPIGMMLPNAPLPPAPPAGAPAKGRRDREQLRQFGAPMRQGPPRGARVPQASPEG